MAGGAGEKTEKATPKRRRDERKKGNIMMSRDIVAVASLFAGYVSLRFAIPIMGDALGEFMRFCIGHTGISVADGASVIGVEIITQSVMTLARSVALPLLLTLLAVVVATFAQTRMLVTFEVIKPKLGKLNPIKGLKNLLSLRSLVEALKGLLKISIILVLLYMFVRDSIYGFSQYMFYDLGTSLGDMKAKSFDLILKIGMAFVVISFFDLLYQRWNYERQIRMSKEEIKEEVKQTEGDPKIKGKIKEAQRKIARSRMMQAVPTADVVIRNPTHFAVALRYTPGKDQAPIVVAKGTDELALRIVAVAEEHGVAVVENRPLARALYAGAEIGQMIPPDQYGPVAEVLVYIYKLNHKVQL